MRLRHMQQEGVDGSRSGIERRKSHLEYYNNSERRVERMSMAPNGKGDG